MGNLISKQSEKRNLKPITFEFQNLWILYPKILYLKSLLYFNQNDLNNAQFFAEKAWIEYESREDELFLLLVDIYKKLEKWEELEDFCFQAYRENEYNPTIFPELYFTLLKRKSFNKADELLERMKVHYPELVDKFLKIKKIQ